MLGYIIIAACIAVFLLITYLPIVRQAYILKSLDGQLEQELLSLSDLFRACLIVETRPLGTGESKNSDITFSDAQANQPLAANAIESIMCEMAEE